MTTRYLVGILLVGALLMIGIGLTLAPANAEIEHPPGRMPETMGSTLVEPVANTVATTATLTPTAWLPLILHNWRPC